MRRRYGGPDVVVAAASKSSSKGGTVGSEALRGLSKDGCEALEPSGAMPAVFATASGLNFDMKSPRESNCAEPKKTSCEVSCTRRRFTDS